MSAQAHQALMRVQSAQQHATASFDHAFVGAYSKLALAMVLGAIVFACFRGIIAALGGGFRSVPRVRSVPLMTDAERRVIAYIEAALPQARIHAQVSMGAIMQPARGMDRRAATITRNRFSSKRYDFVAEDRSTGKILCIVELDDWSHNRSNDKWRDELSAGAGYITIRLPAGAQHTRLSVNERIKSALFPQASETGSRPSKGGRP